MKHKILAYIIGLGTILLVVLAIFYPHQMMSPGNVIDAHRELEKDCFACHAAFLGISSTKCIACHKIEEIGLKTTKGLSISNETKSVTFHQNLNANTCGSCHSDHKGVMPFRPISNFSHDLLDQTQLKQCESCHTQPGDALHLKIKDNCVQCHTISGWTPATFEHNRYFRFDRHHKTKCETCHVNNNYEKYTCYGCHEHSRSKIREEHVEEGIYNYESCSDCHRSGDEDEAKQNFRKKERDNSSTQPFRKNKKHHDDDD
jgi:hypothetical protein